MFMFKCPETVDMMSYIGVEPGWLVVIRIRGNWNEKIESTFNEIAQEDHRNSMSSDK